MAKQLQYIKSTPAHLSRVLYCVTFFVLANLITVPYVRLVARTFGDIVYRDNLEARPWVLTIFLALCTLGFYWGNKRVFNAIKRESSRMWAFHLGIDMLIYTGSILLVLFSNQFMEKQEPSMSDLLNPVMILLVLSCKYTFMRLWYAQRDDRYMSR